MRREISSPASSITPAAAVALDDDARDARVGAAASRPLASAALAIAAATAPMPPLRQAPAPPAARRPRPARRLSSRISELGERGPSQAPSTVSKASSAFQPVVGQLVVQHVRDVDQEHAQELAELVLAQQRTAKAELGELAGSRCRRPWRARRRGHGLEGRQHAGKGHQAARAASAQAARSARGKTAGGSARRRPRPGRRCVAVGRQGRRWSGSAPA